MYPWQCCRTCLSSQDLNPIFSLSEYSEKYTNIIFMTTGVKVQINDNLPQEMCSTCINFINESVKFRRNCEESQKYLESKSRDTFCDVKLESQVFKTELHEIIAIEIPQYLRNEDDFRDFDDNIPLDNFRIKDKQENPEVQQTNEQLEVEFETKVQDMVEQPIEIIFNNKTKEKNSKNVNEKPVRKKQIRKKQIRKKENKPKEQKETNRIKEEIECEYCHKILTSKLSLRNHYKIHTGFDVVCEHCGKKFITRRLLLMHCRAKHGYEKTDKCSYCDYRASNAEQVKIHERLHTGERPYVCAQCGAGFHRKSSYLQHVAIHLPEKTVQCDQCPARFKSVTLMRIHKNRHRAPRYTFTCRVCNNAFARRRNVARHLQRVHGLQPDPAHIHRAKIA